MNFLKNILSRKDEAIKSYEDFWNWFQKNEKEFYKVVKQKGNIEKDFFNKLSPKLNELKEGFYYLTGMLEENTAELVLTPDGNIKNIVFVEELINAAPDLPGWKFTALKPAEDIENVRIDMAGYVFDSDSLFFYSNDFRDYPDEIDITVVHRDFKEEDKTTITNGTCIFLDSFIGELNFATTIDNLTVIGKNDAQQELVPIEKLKNFLIWRQKEFIEKYEGVRLNTENDTHSILEAEHESGEKLVATINTELLEWDSKASHPWIATVEMKYDGTNNNGMPDPETFQLLNDIENEMLIELKDFDGCLNIGRQTARGVREVYFACRDFRKPSKVFHGSALKYGDKFDFSYDIYKDKYWQTFKRFSLSTIQKKIIS